MSNECWLLLDRLREQLDGLADWPPGLPSALADRLEEALASPSRAPLEALSGQLVDLLDRLLSLAPAEAVRAAQGAIPADAPSGAAYLLGQVGFAQLLASQAAERRADDEFLGILRDRQFVKYIEALARQDHTGMELAEATGERVETVSRKLKRLREFGVTEFRREGTRLVNFLTPAARAAIEEPEEAGWEEVVRMTAKNDALSRLFESLPAPMQRLQTFNMPNPSPSVH